MIKRILYYSIWKTSFFRRTFTCITAEALQITRVKSAPYLGTLFDENLNWHGHVDQTCAPLAKFFRIFSRVKHFVSLQITRQSYFAIIYSRIQYGIEVYGSCTREIISKLLTKQNKLLKLLLKCGLRSATEFAHHRLSILKVNDVHRAKKYLICE